MKTAIVLLLLTVSVASAAPDADELNRQAERCRRLLKESVIDFYLPGSLDLENGGFHEDLRDDNFANRGEKFLTLQARQVWLFSTLAKAGYDRERTLRAANHGYEFLHDKFRDKTQGGYFSKVTDAGEIKDARKHAYLNSFALYALVAYAEAGGEQKREALAAAKKLFTVLERNAYDRKYGGYIEFFERDWKPVTNNTAAGYVGAIGHKTYNTHLHLLESYAELYRAWPDPRVLRRLSELIAINISTVQYPTVHANVDAFHRDWSIVQEPRNLRASYGHDVECVWLVIDAARTIQMNPQPLLNWARTLTENSLQFGYDREHGGFYNGGPLGKPADDLKKTWWVQVEALLGMLEMYRLTGDQKYYDAFSRTLDFCEKYQIAKEGGWWSTRAADGSATNDKTRASMWQGGYHSGRALLLSAEWLSQMAKKK
ncbi:MAG TPA: AGE family epimerase/isomerase [Verrucomicrobiae bacterium]